jgi:hypothetical protein
VKGDKSPREVAILKAGLLTRVEEAARCYGGMDRIEVINPPVLLRTQNRGTLLPCELPELSSESGEPSRSSRSRVGSGITSPRDWPLRNRTWKRRAENMRSDALASLNNGSYLWLDDFLFPFCLLLGVRGALLKHE